MRKKNLLESFTDTLIQRVSNRKQLVYQIADILHIEKESAYRRLSGKVQFTVREIGILAEKMDISLDTLLNEDSGNNIILFKLSLITPPVTIEILEQTIEGFVLAQKEARVKNAEVGSMVNSLPIEFYTFQPNLRKFMYFKWGHNYVGSKEYDNFSSWNIPERLIKAQNNYLECFKEYKRIMYIWDNPIIWNLVNEIKYYKLINVLTTDDLRLIKEDLHTLLDDLEELLKGDNKMNPYHSELKFYITNFNISATCNYIFSNNSYLSSVRATLLQSLLLNDYETGYKIHQWIDSIKKFSSLVSGSGERNRKIFFIEQHSIIDNILKD